MTDYNFSNKHAAKMTFGMFDVGEDGEYSGVGFEKISIAFVTQNVFFFGTESFDRCIPILSNSAISATLSCSSIASHMELCHCFLGRA